MELARQAAGKAAFLGFEHGTRMVGNQPTQYRVGVLDVAEVAGTVERMKAGIGELGRIPDVVQPRGGFEKLGVII